ncbi:MAG: fibronectin type III domain-containing protein [Clostridium sp.]|nr:fibronectin type III domain-containing protein [Clostridium sp.]
MNAKNRLIEQLLRVAKRHKILTYPVLALVSVISILSYFFDWSTGAGKRVVAVFMVMVMLVSQSYFLTSSASEQYDTSLVTAENEAGSGNADTSGSTKEEGGSPLVDSADTAQSAADNKEEVSAKQETANESKDNNESASTTETTETSAPNETNSADNAVTNADVADTDVTAESVQGEGEVSEDTEEENNDIATLDDSEAEYGKVNIAFYMDDGDFICAKEAALDSEGKIDASVFADARATFDTMMIQADAYAGCFEFGDWYVGNDKLDENTIYHDGESVIVKSRAKQTHYKLTIKYWDGNITRPYTGAINLVGGSGNMTVTDGTIMIPVDRLGPTKVVEIVTPADKEGYQVDLTERLGCPDSEGAHIQLSDVTVSQYHDSFLPKVTFKWVPEKYIINYKINGTISKEKVDYGSESLYAANYVDSLVPRDGYTVNNWKLEPDTGLGTVEPGGSLPDDWRKVLYGDYKKNNDQPAYYIVPNYEPIDIAIGEDKNPNEVSYEFEYGVYKDEQIVRGHYINDATGKGSDKFEYDLAEDIIPVANLRAKGIRITAESDGIHIAVDPKGPTDITDGEIAVPFSIIDNNINKSDRNKQNKDFTIKIKIGPRVIRPEDIEATTISKVYDGKTEYTGEKFKFETTIKGVSLVVPEQADNVQFATKDAGPTSVLLRNCALEFNTALGGSNCDSRHYVLANSEFTTTGTIEKRKVGCKITVIKPDRGYVRAGEANPLCEIVEDKTLYSGANTGFLDADKGKINIKDYVEVYAVDRADSKLSVDNPTMTCHMGLQGKTGISSGNYVFGYFVETDGGTITNSDTAFEVRLEKPEGYAITPPDPATGWHNLATAHELYLTPAVDGYDSIQILEDNGDYPGRLVMTEDHIVDGKITFRLYDSKTHAYTSYITEEAKVDLVVPEYLSYALSTEEGSDEGLYFPSEGESVSFGNYFNKTVTFTIRYKDETSGAKYLYYILTNTLSEGHSAATSGNAFSTLFSKTDVEGEYVANITVPADMVDKMGQIVFWAEDEAGNREPEEAHLLRRNNEGADEWAVEQNGPKLSTLEVVTADGRRVTGFSDRYYASCVANIHAEDATSGLHDLVWYVKGAEDNAIQVSVAEESSVAKTTEQDFELAVNEEAIPGGSKDDKPGYYELYAQVTDNAGNVSESNHVSFYVDDVNPVIQLDEDYDYLGYHKTARIDFEVWDTISGVAHIDVWDATDPDHRVRMYDVKTEDRYTTEDGIEVTKWYFNTSAKGVYEIVAEDYAGNTYTERIDLYNVSNEVPPCPQVILPEANDNGWISADDAIVQVQNVTRTDSDGMGVRTYYEMWKEGESSGTPIHLPSTAGDFVNVKIPGEGVINLHTWSESLTGVKCEEPKAHVYNMKVDLTKPVIEKTITRGSGSTIRVNFNVTDTLSGVNQNAIKVIYNGQTPQAVSHTQIENGYSCSFVVDKTGSYVIQAADMAGNETVLDAYSPMSMRVNAVRDITDTQAIVGARVIKGTSDIDTVNISYCKTAEYPNYTENSALPIKDSVTGNFTISASLDDLTPGTNYVYRVRAVSADGEILEYEGYFRTLSAEDQGVNVSGMAYYSDPSVNGIITVGLYRGNECIRAKSMNTAEEQSFTFENVPDGVYNIVATDEIHSKSARVVISNGSILYPQNSSIVLILSSRNTSVEIAPDDVTEGDKNLYKNVSVDNLDSIFDDTTNFGDEYDEEWLENGGNIEFKLYASLIKTANVGDGVPAIVYRVAGEYKIVAAYLDFSIYKIYTDSAGNIISRKQVHTLGGGSSVDITIPLGDLAGKPGLEVIRVHGNEGTSLADLDGPGNATYTINSNLFSTYALVYSMDRTEDPNTPNTPNTPTVNNGVGTTGPSTDGSIYTGDDIGGEEIPIDSTQSPAHSTNNNSSFGSLRSNGSAKTGDTAPIAAVALMMIAAAGGVVVLRKKSRQYD